MDSTPLVEISTDFDRIDMAMVSEFLAGTYWALGRPREVVEQSFRNSLCFSAFRATKQIGFARVITDKATFGYVADVFVLPEYRGQGIAKALMQAILAHPDLQSLRHLLLRTRDAHGLYAQFGFCPLAKPDELMSRLATD